MKGELKKSVLQSLKEFQARAKAQEQKNKEAEKTKAHKKGGCRIMMDLAMNFDTDECLVTAMFDKGNRNDTMEAIDHIIPFLKGDADMIGLVCNTLRKLFCMSDEGYETFLMDLEDYKSELEEGGMNSSQSAV